MAVIGMTIGISFSLAMVISPALSSRYGLSGIFYLTAILAIIGLLLLHLTVPTPVKECFHGDSEANPALFKSVITDTHLLRLNLGIFCQHFILTSTFFVIPLILNNHIQQGHIQQPWHFYLSIMVLAFIFMVPFIIFGEKKNKLKLVYLGSILSTILTQYLLQFSYQSWFMLCLLMFLYFVAFNILEALLPSQISKQANPKSKGTAMGIYSTSQFLGIFVGGSASGFLYQWNGHASIFISNAVLSLVWFIVSCPMKTNPTFATLILHYQNQNNHQKEQALIEGLTQLSGVQDTVLAKEENVIYLRVDKALYHEGSAEALLKTLRNQE
jgi:predicted MFS family arabinose efflux permease